MSVLKKQFIRSYILKAAIVGSIDEEAKFKVQYEKHLRSLKYLEMSVVLK